MDSFSELIKALENFSPPVASAIEYRVYYDPESGDVLNYTNDDLPGTYIIVDRETFARHRFDCKIKNGKIVPYRLPIGKLVPSTTGTPCMINDVCLIVQSETTAQHWKLRTYED